MAVENRGTATNYTYVDYSPEQGVNFYRLKVTDIEGEVLYSNTVQLSFGRQALSDQGIVYPNPVTRDIQIKVSALKGQVCSVNIVDMKGATVLTKEVQLQQGVNSLTFDIDQLVPGTYVIRLEVDQKSVQDRFIKQ